MKRVVATVQTKLGTEPFSEMVGANDVAVVANVTASWISSQEHVGFSAEQHLHEGSELLRLVGDRLPTNVLHARSRRPGRRA